VGSAKLPGVSFQLTLDMTHPGLRKVDGTPDPRKIGRVLRLLGQGFGEGGEKELAKLSGSLIIDQTRAGWWVVHADDTDVAERDGREPIVPGLQEKLRARIAELEKKVEQYQYALDYPEGDNGTP
jgi:hypothetical protein